MDFNKLNENQKKAVLATDGPLLVFAGAGSGKTRVITYRTAYLIGEKKVPPFSIFAVTFTNKAAGEMKKRVIDLVGPEGNSVFIKTFHAASVYMLRNFGQGIGIPRYFSIYDDTDQQTVIKEVLLSMRLDPKKISPSMIASKISEIKDRAELIDGGDPARLLPDYFSFNFPEVYREYHSRLASLNALDFNDLLIKAVQLLRTDSRARETMQRMWSHFMIDEYQDTNHAQYLIAKLLAEKSRNICVVGDDDQSIYSWRGADIRNILDFERDYPDAGVITLEENYRSTEPILTAASSVIKNNGKRKPKELRSVKGDGEPVVWCRANNEYGEAEYVVNTITGLKRTEGFKNRDFSVFYRTNAQSRVFEDHLRKENLPYRVVGGLKFYDRKEIKDIIAYLRFIANPLDIVSFLRIINVPARGIGRTTLDRIRAEAAEKNMPEWLLISEGRLDRPPKGVEEFVKIISRSMEISRKIPEIKLSTFVNDVINESGYRAMLEGENTTESESRLENLEELVNGAYDYENSNRDATLDQFLQDISLLTTEENPETDPENRDNCVTLMTVHNAKGLEFPVVFLTGMEEDTFPHRLSVDTEEGIEEERRLCYVGITRAMERVYLVSADIRRSYAGIFYKQPSRFISEIPESIMESVFHASNDFSGNGFSGQDGGRRTWNSGQTGYGPKKISPSAGDAPRDTGSMFSVKERVMHPKYGPGRIERIEGEGDNIKLTIVFNSGRKTFLEKYTPLEKMT